MAENKYYRLNYELFAHDKEGGTPILVEKTSADHPFEFITGLGYTLPDFEQEISQLDGSAKFDFVIPCERAYGEYDEV